VLPIVCQYAFVPLNEPCLCVFVPIFLIPHFSNIAPLAERAFGRQVAKHSVNSQTTSAASPSWPPPTRTASQTRAGSWLGLRFFGTNVFFFEWFFDSNVDPDIYTHLVFKYIT